MDNTSLVDVFDPDENLTDIQKQFGKDFMANGPALGWIFLLHSIFYTIPYVPCIIVMLEQPLVQNSCFKIMATMGVCDLGNLLFAGYASAIFSILGIGYDTHWSMMKAMSSPLMYLWSTYCYMSMLLGFNRCIDLYSKPLSIKLFGEKKTYYWIMASLFYGLTYLFCFMLKDIDIVYHDALGVWVYTGYGRYFGLFNNILVTVVIISEYIILLILFKRKTSDVSEQVADQMEEKERLLMIQSCLICTMTLTCAISYIVIPFLKPDPLLYASANIMWQICQGGNSIIYLTLNKTIRKKVLVKFGLAKYFQNITGLTAAPVTTTNHVKVSKHSVVAGKPHSINVNGVPVPGNAWPE